MGRRGICGFGVVDDHGGVEEPEQHLVPRPGGELGHRVECLADVEAAVTYTLRRADRTPPEVRSVHP